MTGTATNWARGILSGSARQAIEAVSRATTGGGRDSSEPVEVYRAINDMEAQVVKSFLESNDIPVMLRSESLGATLGITVGMLAEVRLFVPALLARQAMDLLEAQAEAVPEEYEALGEDPESAGE